MTIAAGLNILKSLLAHQSRKAGVSPHMLTPSHTALLVSQTWPISALWDAISRPTLSKKIQSTQSAPLTIAQIAPRYRIWRWAFNFFFTHLGRHLHMPSRTLESLQRLTQYSCHRCQYWWPWCIGPSELANNKATWAKLPREKTERPAGLSRSKLPADYPLAEVNSDWKDKERKWVGTAHTPIFPVWYKWGMPSFPWNFVAGACASVAQQDGSTSTNRKILVLLRSADWGEFWMKLYVHAHPFGYKYALSYSLDATSLLDKKLEWIG